MTMQTFKDLNKQGGITLFEIVVIVLLIGVLVSFAIDKLMRAEIVAEKIAVEQNLVVIKSALNLEVAERVVKQGLQSIKELENTNPLRYLLELPYNYIGIKSDINAENIPVKSWYYDEQKNILVYKVANVNYFETALAGTPRVRFKVVTIYNDDFKHNKQRVIRGVTVKSLDDYRWNFD